MYVHVGNDVVIKTEDVIGFFDAYTIKLSRTNLKLINLLKNEPNDIKSIIVTQKDEVEKHYFSNFSTRTIRNRMDMSFNNNTKEGKLNE